jgi:CheY-like chemotaxis protein
MNQSLGPGPLLDGVRVLVVDDHPVVREVIAELLKDFGASVTAVPGVPEALESLERERPTVMLADIELPGEDGYALIRKVRALSPDRGGQTPAAALTGLATPEDRARALRAGFHDHAAKPIDTGQLVRLVTTLAARG